MPKLKAKKPKDIKPGKCKGVLFGKSGAGKTWFALNFPKVYFIDTEGGATLSHYTEKLEKSGGVYLGQEDGSCDFETILDQMKALATEKHEYKTLVVDSITKVFQTEIANESERLGSKDVFGASKKPAYAYMRRLFNWVNRLDMNIWFIAHQADEWGMVNGERQQIGSTADVWEKLIYELDITLRIENPRTRYRVAHVHKTRLKGFPEHDTFVLQDGDKDTGYSEFAKRYGKDYIEADSHTITLCTPEQVKNIQTLVGMLKIDEKEIEKILKKGRAETFEELSEEHAEKMISWLKSKFKEGEK